LRGCPRPASTGRRRLSTMMCDASRMVDLSGRSSVCRTLPTSRRPVALHQTEPVVLGVCECGHHTRQRGKALLQALMELLVREAPGVRHEPLAAMARARRAPEGDCGGGWLCPAPAVAGGSGLGRKPPRKEKAMPPEHITTAGGGPRERSEDQGLL